MTYTADDYNGYVAKVTYDGQFNHLEVIPYPDPAEHQDHSHTPVEYIISDSQNTAELSSYKEPPKYRVPVYEPKATTPSYNEPSYKVVQPSVSIVRPISSSQYEKQREERYKVVVPSYKESNKESVKYEEEEYKSKFNYKESSSKNKDNSESLEYRNIKKPTEIVEELQDKSEPIKTIKVDSKVNVYRPESALVYSAETVPVPSKKIVTTAPVVYKPETLTASTPQQTAIYRAIEPAKTSPWSIVYNPPPPPAVVAPAANYRPAAPTLQRSPPASVQTVSQPSYRTPTPINYRPPPLPAAPSTVYRPTSPVAFSRPAQQGTPAVNRPPPTQGIIPSSVHSGLRYRIVPASSYSPSPYQPNGNAPIAYRLVRKPSDRIA